jgi:beta-phosphoglucomutase
LIDAVLFDYDGVLMQSHPYHVQAWRAEFAASDFDVDVADEDVLLYEGSMAINIGRRLFLKSGIAITEEELTAFTQRKQERYRQITRATVMPGVPEFVDFLSEAGTRIAIVTGTSRLNLEKSLPASLIKKFNGIVTCESVERAKPHPEPYLMGAEKLGVPPSKCLVVENAPLGIQAGKAAGMRVAALLTTLARGHLEGADVYFKDIVELHANWRLVTR